GLDKSYRTSYALPPRSSVYHGRGDLAERCVNQRIRCRAESPVVYQAPAYIGRRGPWGRAVSLDRRFHLGSADPGRIGSVLAESALLRRLAGYLCESRDSWCFYKRPNIVF